VQISVSNLHSTKLEYTYTHTAHIHKWIASACALFPFPCRKWPNSAAVAGPTSLAPATPKKSTHHPLQCTTPSIPSGTPCLSLTFASLSLLFNFICFGRRRVYATHCNIEKFLCCHLPCPPYRPLAPLSPLSPLSPHFPPEFRLHSL